MKNQNSRDKRKDKLDDIIKLNSCDIDKLKDLMADVYSEKRCIFAV